MNRLKGFSTSGSPRLGACLRAVLIFWKAFLHCQSILGNCDWALSVAGHCRKPWYPDSTEACGHQELFQSVPCLRLGKEVITCLFSGPRTFRPCDRWNTRHRTFVGRFELSSKKPGNLSQIGAEGVLWSCGGNGFGCCLPREGHPHIGAEYIMLSFMGSR
jgi:hypothetical protein